MSSPFFKSPKTSTSRLTKFPSELKHVVGEYLQPKQMLRTKLPQLTKITLSLNEDNYENILTQLSNEIYPIKKVKHLIIKIDNKIIRPIFSVLQKLNLKEIENFTLYCDKIYGEYFYDLVNILLKMQNLKNLKILGFFYLPRTLPQFSQAKKDDFLKNIESMFIPSNFLYDLEFSKLMKKFQYLKHLTLTEIHPVGIRESFFHLNTQIETISIQDKTSIKFDEFNRLIQYMEENIKDLKEIDISTIDMHYWTLIFQILNKFPNLKTIKIPLELKIYNREISPSKPYKNITQIWIYMGNTKSQKTKSLPIEIFRISWKRVLKTYFPQLKIFSLIFNCTLSEIPERLNKRFIRDIVNEFPNIKIDIYNVFGDIKEEETTYIGRLNFSGEKQPKWQSKEKINKQKSLENFNQDASYDKLKQKNQKWYDPVYQYFMDIASDWVPFQFS